MRSNRHNAAHHHASPHLDLNHGYFLESHVVMSSTDTLVPNTPPEHLVDARGLNCPLPLLRLRQALHQRAIGDQLRLLTTDPISQQDIRRYCELSGQILLAAWADPAHGFFGFDLQKTH